MRGDTRAMIPVTKRSALLAACAVLVAVALASPVSAAAPKTRSCGTVSVKLKGGKKSSTSTIHATRYGCRLARLVARTCLRDHLRGWKTYTAPSLDDTDPHGLTGLDRGSAHISFEVHGGRGCV